MPHPKVSKRLILRLPHEAWNQLDSLASERGTSIAAIIRTALLAAPAHRGLPSYRATREESRSTKITLTARQYQRAIQGGKRLDTTPNKWLGAAVLQYLRTPAGFRVIGAIR